MVNGQFKGVIKQIQLFLSFNQHSSCGVINLTCKQIYLHQILSTLVVYLFIHVVTIINLCTFIYFWTYGVLSQCQLVGVHRVNILALSDWTQSQVQSRVYTPGQQTRKLDLPDQLSSHTHTAFTYLDTFPDPQPVPVTHSSSSNRRSLNYYYVYFAIFMLILSRDQVVC